MDLLGLQKHVQELSVKYRPRRNGQPAVYHNHTPVAWLDVDVMPTPTLKEVLVQQSLLVYWECPLVPGLCNMRLVPMVI